MYRFYENTFYINILPFQIRKTKSFCSLYSCLWKSPNSQSEFWKAMLHKALQCNVKCLLISEGFSKGNTQSTCSLLPSRSPFHLFPNPDYSLDDHFDHIKLWGGFNPSKWHNPDNTRAVTFQNTAPSPFIVHLFSRSRQKSRHVTG